MCCHQYITISIIIWKSDAEGVAELHPYSIHPLPSTFLSKYDLTTQNIMRKDDIVLK